MLGQASFTQSSTCAQVLARPAALQGAQLLNPVPCLCGLIVLASNGGVRTGLFESLLRATLTALIFTDNVFSLLGCGRSRMQGQSMGFHHRSISRVRPRHVVFGVGVVHVSRAA